MIDMREWLANKEKQQKRLYQQYGKALEKEHTGEYVAISTEGQTILGTRLGEVLKQAIDAFGRDNFAIARVGHETVEQWRQIAA